MGTVLDKPVLRSVAKLEALNSASPIAHHSSMRAHYYGGASLAEASRIEMQRICDRAAQRRAQLDSVGKDGVMH